MPCGMAQAHAKSLQSKQSQAQPSGQGVGKPHVLLIAVFRIRYLVVCVQIGQSMR